jgi:hypothetical protein
VLIFLLLFPLFFAFPVFFISYNKVWAQYLGIVSTLFLVPADLLHDKHRTLEVVIFMVSYVLAMMFLRTAVMGNNALLSKFQDTKRIKLSLLANAVGFSGNLGGLSVVAFCSTWIIPPREMLGIRRECWWILVFVVIATIFAVFMHLCPSDHEDEDQNISHQEDHKIPPIDIPDVSTFKHI